MATFQYERRKEPRRKLELPVLLSATEQTENETAPQLGNIVNAGLGGIQVQTHSCCTFGVTAQIQLLVIAEPQGELMTAEVPVKISGQIIWHDKKQKTIGLKYL